MSKHESSKGQQLVERIEAYITRYVNLPDTPKDQALVLALWVIHTWLSDRFRSTPYLTITASVKQAGKTLCMEVLSLLCRNSKMLATVRPLAMVRIIGAFDSRCTLAVDEAEKLSGAAVGDLRSIFTTGYREGGKHAVSAGKEYVEYPTYCPKMFALIGDVMDVVRDRSITIYLRRAVPAVDFLAHRDEAEVEATGIVASIMTVFDAVPALAQPMHLQGRAREIWTVLYSIAGGLKLDAATMTRLDAVSADLVGMNTAEAREYRDAQAERSAEGDMLAERAIVDLESVIGEGERGIHSAVAVERMRAITTAPWRTYKGDGLTQNRLADLIAGFSLGTETVWMGKGRAGRKSGMGYSAAKVRAALAAVRSAASL